MSVMTKCIRCGGTGEEPKIEEIAKEMRGKRIALGWTLKRMALELFVSPSFLSDMEHGKRNWSQERIGIVRKLKHGSDGKAVNKRSAL